MKHLQKILFAVGIVLVLGAIPACGGGGGADPDLVDTTPVHSGKAIMEKHCGRCHMVPEPKDLDTLIWHRYVLVRMANYMGLWWDSHRYYDEFPQKWLEPGEGGARVMEAGVYPQKPTITKVEFEQILDYILQNAPPRTNPPSGILPIAPETPLFKVKAITAPEDYVATTTGVMISEQDKCVYASLYKQDVLKMSVAGKVLDKWNGPIGAVKLLQDEKGFRVVDIGDMIGADTPKGAYWSARNFAELKRGKGKVLDKLQRPVHIAGHDLDGDGLEDLVLSEYGNQLGQITWRKQLPNGEYESHLLYPDDGAISAYVHDFNGDSLPDIAALVANADEQLLIFTNRGDGTFGRKVIRRFNPTWGSTALEMVDFDGDGLMDLLASNGDNADYPAILKPHHGIRLYRNKGNLEFEEAFYLPMNGAYGTQTADFDQDGDLDIAAVSFYPDYGTGARESFLFFENKGNGEFASSTIPDHGLGRWMILDAGDLDGDGDLDLVLGAFNVKSTEVPASVSEVWATRNVMIVILENQLKQAG